MIDSVLDEGKIPSCSHISELLGESPVPSIHKVDLIVTLVSPCMLYVNESDESYHSYF